MLDALRKAYYWGRYLYEELWRSENDSNSANGLFGCMALLSI